MKLLTVGDSFTYGDELENVSRAWPFQLGQLLNYEVTNLGLSSGSNTQMLRKVIENYKNYDLVIIAWTHFARVEFSDFHGTFDIWPGCFNKLFDNKLQYRQTLIEYITKHHDDIYLYKQYLINIILLQNFLKHNDKKYIMIDAFGNNQVRLLNSNLTDLVDPTYYLGWPTESMMDWTYGVSKGPKGHFLEDGHKIVADKIYEHIRYLGWIS